MANKHQRRRANRNAKRKADRIAAQLTPLQLFIRDKLRLQAVPFEVEIGIQGTTLTAKKCHVNCEKIIAAAPFMEAQSCWIIHTCADINDLTDHLRETGVLSPDQHAMVPRMNADDYEAEFHSILRDTRTGVFYDITRDMLPSCTERTVVLEPRMSSADWLKYSRQAPENICTAQWGARSAPAEEQPDFFNIVAEVDMIKSFNASGNVLFAR
jgi:hypothetical protein